MPKKSVSSKRPKILCIKRIKRPPIINLELTHEKKILMHRVVLSAISILELKHFRQIIYMFSWRMDKQMYKNKEFVDMADIFHFRT